jgi:hypothetical protein
MYENNDSSYEDEEEQAFRDYAFESQWNDVVGADKISMRYDHKGNWYMILRMPKKKNDIKSMGDDSFGFDI